MTFGRIGFVLAFLTFFLPASARWDRERSPFDYTRATEGGKYIFVMLRPKEDRQYSYDYTVYSDPSSQMSTGKNGALQTIYPSSGLYRNDGSKQPLWIVDWYSYEVWPCSDGEHLVRWGPWARSGDKGKTLAVAFYQSGKEVKGYKVADLIADYKSLPSTISHYQWAKQKSFDDSRKTVKVQFYKDYDYRNSGRTLLFDIVTGKFKAIGDKS